MLPIKRIDIRQLQVCNVDRQAMAATAELGMGVQERREFRTQIAQGPRGRWVLTKIGEDQSIKSLRPKYGVQRRIIL